MKKQLSSLDLHHLLKELEVLKDSRIDKIYQPEKNSLIFSLYKTNIGKKLLKINIGQSLFIAEEKEDYGEILGFGMFLRKHLGGYFLFDVGQIKPERIIKFSFKIKDDKKYLYLEFFGRGNAILCYENDIIINSLEHHEFKDRTIKPKIKYKYPIMKYNFFDLDKNGAIDLLKSSKKDSIVICLAVELGLGGVYSEEICLLSEMDKNQKPQDISEKQMQLILNSIKNLVNKKIEPQVIFEDNNLIDVVPFGLQFYQNYQRKSFPAFGEALSFFCSHFKEVKQTEFDKKLRNLQRIVEEQKAAIEELKNQEKELREKAELIYHKYSLIKEILNEINKASKKYSWKEIKERLKEHTIIKEVNEKERKIVVEI